MCFVEPALMCFSRLDRGGFGGGPRRCPALHVASGRLITAMSAPVTQLQFRHPWELFIVSCFNSDIL